MPETDVVVALVKSEKHPGGRPSEYKSEFLHIAEKYLVEFANEGDPVPMVEGLADKLGYSRKTIYNWAKEHPEFQEIIDRIVTKQGKLLQAGGLRKEYDSGITKLLLSADHGKAEKSEQKTEHSGEIKFSSADKAIHEIDSKLKQ